MTTVDQAFRSVRNRVLEHMTLCEQARLQWSETAITENVIAQAAQAHGVCVAPFTQRAEALSGADWIWWWVDGTGAFGMLVQAKRLTVTGNKWSFGFDYKSGNAGRQQREILTSAAESLGLLPAYALYLGTGDYREWERCSDDHESEHCFHCLKRAVSLMPALLAEESIVNDAGSVYKRSVALEDLRMPPSVSAPLIPTLKKQLAPDLAGLLQEPQNGTRAVTRTMIDLVLKARYASFSTVTTSVANAYEGDHDQLGPVFRKLPEDSGHWGLKYFDHIMNPLRHVPPDYVLEIRTGEFDKNRIAAEMPANIAGVVVVQLPQRHKHHRASIKNLGL